MKVLILETNLMWSARLVRSLAALSHEGVVESSLPVELEGFDLAIVNLASPDMLKQVAGLKESGIKIIAHAGHKEKDLHALGRAAGIDRLATNGELTWKIEAILAEG